MDKVDSKKIFNELVQALESVSDQITDSYKEHFEHKLKYVVFVTASDMKSRGLVAKGISNDIPSAFKNAKDLVLKKCKDKNVQPKVFKADLVITMKEMTYDELTYKIRNTKINYFHHGLTLDDLFNHAYLQEEIIGNAFITRPKDIKKNLLNFNNINFYRNNVCMEKGKLTEDDFEKAYLFKTCGFYHDGELIALENGELNNGRRKVQVIDSELCKRIVIDSSDYLAKQVMDNGQFRYGYFACFDKEISHYNILRHASTLYAMVEAYELDPCEDMAVAIRKGLAYLEREGIRVMENVVGKTRAFVIEESGGNEIKLGANSAAILAYSKYTKVFGDSSYMELMDQLAMGIEFFQNPYNGSFVHVLNYPDLDIKELNRIIYYDGEASFALMRLYELTKDKCYIDMVEKAFTWYLKKNYEQYQDHWLSYCSYELLKHAPKREYMKFNLENAKGMLDFASKRNTTFPTLLELMLATKEMINTYREDPMMVELLTEFDEAYLDEVIDYRIHHQLDGYFFPEVAMYYKRPDHILGSFFIRHHSMRVRIDDVQHNISGYCRYYYTYLK